jgi:hypothetical protein
MVSLRTWFVIGTLFHGKGELFQALFCAGPFIFGFLRVRGGDRRRLNTDGFLQFSVLGCESRVQVRRSCDFSHRLARAGCSLRMWIFSDSESDLVDSGKLVEQNGHLVSSFRFPTVLLLSLKDAGLELIPMLP